MEKGKLVRWNNSKGFGFIKPEIANGKDVFIHISALKHMARKPIIGDEILYHAEQQADGKVRAVKASIEGVAVIASSQKKSPQSRANPQMSRAPKSSVKPTILVAIIITGIVGSAFTQYQKSTVKPTSVNQVQPDAEWQKPQPTFSCETGKYHCSQMKSCAEATFYIQNCPDTKMDGDGDGIPCERQWCR